MLALECCQKRKETTENGSLIMCLSAERHLDFTSLPLMKQHLLVILSVRQEPQHHSPKVPSNPRKEHGPSEHAGTTRLTGKLTSTLTVQCHGKLKQLELHGPYHIVITFCSSILLTSQIQYYHL